MLLYFYSSFRDSLFEEFLFDRGQVGTSLLKAPPSLTPKAPVKSYLNLDHFLEMSIEQALQKPKHAIVLLNAQAGQVLQKGVRVYKTELTSYFEKVGFTADIRAIKAKKLEKALQEALAEEPDLVVVSGGDGTISRLLPTLLKSEKPIAILPLGTLNLLARDLGLTGTPQTDVPYLCKGEECVVDIGRVNGIPFHSSVGLGFVGTMADEREQARKRFPFSKIVSFFWAAWRTLRYARSMTVELEVGGHAVTLEADAVIVTNNAFVPTPLLSTTLWQRPVLDGGYLEVHVLRTKGFLGRLKASLAAARGTWRDLPSLTSFTAKTVTLQQRDHHKSTVAVDGELYRLANPLVCTIDPKALRFLKHEKSHDA
jgi:diacylglycerol kinase family enzyme